MAVGFYDVAENWSATGAFIERYASVKVIAQLGGLPFR